MFEILLFSGAGCILVGITTLMFYTIYTILKKL